MTVSDGNCKGWALLPSAPGSPRVRNPQSQHWPLAFLLLPLEFTFIPLAFLKCVGGYEAWEQTLLLRCKSSSAVLDPLVWDHPPGRRMPLLPLLPGCDGALQTWLKAHSPEVLWLNPCCHLNIVPRDMAGSSFAFGWKPLPLQLH